MKLNTKELFKSSSHLDHYSCNTLAIGIILLEGLPKFFPENHSRFIDQLACNYSCSLNKHEYKIEVYMNTKNAVGGRFLAFGSLAFLAFGSVFLAFFLLVDNTECKITFQNINPHKNYNTIGFENYLSTTGFFLASVAISTT